MSISALIRHFEAMGSVPVDAQDVFTELLVHILDEKVSIHGVDLTQFALRGLHFRYHIPPIKDSVLMPERNVMVLYDTSQTIDWQRLTICKELVHVFDREPIWSQGREKIVRLASSLCNQPVPSKADETNLDVFFDRLGLYQALAILFPFSLREQLIEKYKSGILDINKVAEIVSLPPQYVNIVMTEHWPDLRETILGNS